MKLIAKTFHGLEALLAQELAELGATNIQPTLRAVEFNGDQTLLYRANLELRTALRILKSVHTFRARNERDLYQQIGQMDWSKLMAVKDTLAVDAIVSSRFFKHSKYVALKTKDAIVDQFRDRFGKRPNVNVHNPSLRINVRIHEDQVFVSLDSSGESLHKRGYRTATVDAPINEVLAAGLVLHSGWQKDCHFIDPMCGSGTILIEAGMYAHNIPPNIQREHFGFMKWKDYDPALWSAIVQAAKEKISNFDYQLLGSDKNLGAVRKTEANADAAGLSDKIEVQRKAFERLILDFEKAM
ncbi:MAG: THUMP domain-containing protein, partial [Bacteroidota bacterium]